jgi:hypothetical protein
MCCRCCHMHCSMWAADICPAHCRITLRLAQDPSSEHLGTTVWDASIVMAKYFEKVSLLPNMAHHSSSSVAHQHAATAEHAQG